MNKCLVTVILAFLVFLPGRGLKAIIERNPLVQAAMSGNIAAVRALLGQGANIEAIDDSCGCTALAGAAANGQADMVKFLLDKGAKIDAGEGGSGTALFRAVEGDRTELVNLLLDKGANVDAADHMGTTPLMEAVEKNQPALVELLLQRGARTDTRDKNGRRTALFRAAMAGNLEILNLLLDKGADANAHLSDDDSALQIAAMNGRNEVVKDLLARGANTEIKDDLCQTPLLIAAQWGKAEVAMQLLDGGAKMEATNNQGETALHVAAQWGSTEVVKLLLDRGAQIEARDKDGFTPLLHAAQAGGIAHAGTTLPVEKFPAVEVVNLLLDRGANIEAKSVDGQTALHRAVMGQRPDALKALLARGANIEATDNQGRTPLILAKRCLRGFEQLTGQMPCSGNSTPRAMQSCQKSVENMLADKKEVVRVLEESLEQHPPSTFADYVADLQNHPRDRARRDHVVELAAALPALPPIPGGAQQRYDRASALMKQSTNPQQLNEAMNLLRGALNIAPWWRDPYLQLSRALELTGQYELAAKNLNYYLELHPPEAEARAAREHLAKIRTMEAASPKNP